MKEDGYHYALVQVENLIKEVPSHCIFDLNFLNFINGERMLPNRYDPFTENDFDFNMPRFSVVIKIMRHLWAWEVLYCCKCDDKYSLQCLSRMYLLIDYWKKQINEYIESESSKERNLILVTDFNECPGLDPFMSVNPIQHIYAILKYYRDRYAICRKSDHYIVYIDAKCSSVGVREAMYQLMKSMRRLPFYLTIECFPFFRITYEMAADFDDMI